VDEYEIIPTRSPTTSMTNQVTSERVWVENKNLKYIPILRITWDIIFSTNFACF
jgi:hypothetical protein